MTQRFIKLEQIPQCMWDDIFAEMRPVDIYCLYVVSKTIKSVINHKSFKGYYIRLMNTVADIIYVISKSITLKYVLINDKLDLSLIRLNLLYNHYYDCVVHADISKMTEKIEIAEIYTIEEKNKIKILNTVDLKKIQVFKNLNHLNIKRQNILNLHILPSFNITRLILFSCDLEDSSIAICQQLLYLECLDISDNNITTCDGLFKLPFLRSLLIASNEIEIIEPSDVSMSLTFINLNSNKIRHLGFSRYFPALNTLYINGNNILFLDGIEIALNLRVLQAAYNRIKYLKPLCFLRKLRSLYLSHNNIKKVDMIAGLPRLHQVDLSFNKIQIISPLLHVHLLNIKHNKITNLDQILQLDEVTDKMTYDNDEYDPICDLF